MNRFFLTCLGLVPTIALSAACGEIIPYESLQYNSECYPTYGYNPPSSFLGGCKGNFFAAAELLYLQADPRIDWAGIVELNFSESADKGEVINFSRLRYDWDPGFRVTLGYNWPHDQWAISADYTYFRTHKIVQTNGFASLEKMKGTFIIPAIGPLQQTIPFVDGNPGGVLFEDQTKVVLHSHLDFNQFTVVTDRQFNVTPCLTLDPYAGFKGLFTTQHYKDIFVAQGTNLQTQLPYIFQNTFNTTLRFAGYGATVGLKTFWNFFSNLSLHTDFGTSLLSTRTHITNSSIGGLVLISEDYHLNEVGYTFDGGLALFLVEPFCRGGSFTVKVGWEAHYIADQNRVIAPNAPFTIPSKPLTLHGLVLGLGISI